MNTLADDGSAVLVSAKARLDGLAPVERELAAAISDLRYQTEVLSQSLAARLRTVDGLVVKLGGTVDEGTRQLKQNGDRLADVTLHVDRLIADNGPRVNNAAAALERGRNGLATAIETSSPEVAKALNNLNTVIIDADGMVKAYTPIGANLSAASANLTAMTEDSKNKFHELLYPAPAKGFWPRTKQVFGYILRPAFEAARLYFTLQSLPVRITEPLPTAKP